VAVYVGSAAVGQGLETVMAQIAADTLGIPLDRVRVFHGSTSFLEDGYGAIEAYAWHKPLLERRGGEYEPRVRTRIERASAMTAVEYIRLRAARGDFIDRVAAQTTGFDAVLMPAVAITAPQIAAFEQDEDYRRLNALLLRNTSVINCLDRCAITVPLRTAGPPVGLMIVGERRRGS
jgi:aspartyl-tRNA(Asn)/glutamyl-tRNA(Gln) amidotransferase subunit A